VCNYKLYPFSKANFESIIHWIFNNPISAADFIAYNEMESQMVRMGVYWLSKFCS